MKSASETPGCSSSEVGYREIIVGNPKAIVSWSLASPYMRDRYETDLARLRRLFESVRSCPPFALTDAAWNAAATCAASRVLDVGLPNYVSSLGVPAPIYQPTPGNLAELIGGLEVDPLLGAVLSVQGAP
ncbi:MAG: hypothetical protein QM756_45845 [Polyangiaceae bacterium]